MDVQVVAYQRDPFGLCIARSCEELPMRHYHPASGSTNIHTTPLTRRLRTRQLHQLRFGLPIELAALRPGRVAPLQHFPRTFLDRLLALIFPGCAFSVQRLRRCGHFPRQAHPRRDPSSETHWHGGFSKRPTCRGCQPAGRCRGGWPDAVCGSLRTQGLWPVSASRHVPV